MRTLTPAEDEELRRLTALAAFGSLTPELGEIYRELRSRDRRNAVREPRELAIPVQATSEPSLTPVASSAHQG